MVEYESPFAPWVDKNWKAFLVQKPVSYKRKYFLAAETKTTPKNNGKGKRA
jgi:hypothetical protein